MTDAPETPPTDAEQQKAFAQSLAFNTEAVRAGLFASAQDISEMLHQNGVPHADAALVTGAVEFAAQLWTQMMFKAGHTPRSIRTKLHEQVRYFHRKHLKAEQAGAEKVTQQ